MQHVEVVAGIFHYHPPRPLPLPLVPSRVVLNLLVVKKKS